MLHVLWSFKCHGLYLDDGVGEGVRDDVEQVGGVLTSLDVEGVDEEEGEFVQNTCGYLQGQKNQHRQPVKEVVDRSASKCPGSEVTQSWTCTRCRLQRYYSPAALLHSLYSSSHALIYLRNSFRSPACIIATIVLVTDVPMLAPMMIGTADFTSSTEEFK